MRRRLEGGPADARGGGAPPLWLPSRPHGTRRPQQRPHGRRPRATGPGRGWRRLRQGQVDCSQTAGWAGHTRWRALGGWRRPQQVVHRPRSTRRCAERPRPVSRSQRPVCVEGGGWGVVRSLIVAQDGSRRRHETQGSKRRSGIHSKSNEHMQHSEHEFNKVQHNPHNPHTSNAITSAGRARSELPPCTPAPPSTLSSRASL